MRPINFVHQRANFFQSRDEIIRFYCAQVIEILAYLQSKGISHRDIKVFS